MIVGPLLQEAVAQYFVVSGVYENPGDSRSTKFVEALSTVARIAQFDPEAIWWLFQVRLDNNSFLTRIERQLREFRSRTGNEQNLEQVTERLRRSASSLLLSCELISTVILRGLRLRDLPIVRHIIRLYWIVTCRPGLGEPLRAPELSRNFLMSLHLPNASLQGWQFEDCTLYKTNFADAYFSRARLNEINFVDCDLRRAHFEPSIGFWGSARLCDVRFTRTIVYKCTFSDAKMINTRVPDYYVTNIRPFTSPENLAPWTYKEPDGSIKAV